MYDYPERKRRTNTASVVAALRGGYKYDPIRFAIPLARRLATLSREYEAVGNLPVARRHLNSAIRAMKRVINDDAIELSRRRELVWLQWQSSSLFILQGDHAGALHAIDEAPRWDAITWDAHVYVFRSREMGRAHMLDLRAQMLDSLGRAPEAVEARIDGIMTALSDPDGGNDEVSRVAARFALEAAWGFAER